MTATVVERTATTQQHSKYDTAALAQQLVTLEKDKALAVDVSNVKFVNFHSALYKKLKSLGYDLHYSKNGNTVTFWL